MSVTDVAAHVGSHPNTCREQLTRLLDAGLVTRTFERSGRRGRPGLRYAATHPEVDPARQGTALVRALVDHIGSLPDATHRAVDVGKRWSRSQAPEGEPAPPMERLLALLDEAGFSPVAPARPGDPVGLRACPFGVFDRGSPGPACGVHRGLLEGALRGLGASGRQVALEPFARPGLCLAYVDTR